MNDMPSHEDLLVLLSGAHIQYFHCVQIVDILKTTEADTKSLFGRYGSQRMKDWQEIVRLYERDSVYLGEAAQILVRNVNYELPAVKKQIAKFEQLIDDAQKKIHDLSTSEAVLNAQRIALCQKIGIDGKNLREEFIERLKELPKFYGEIVKAIVKIDNALQLYADTSRNADCLPIVRVIASKGNVTVYEYAHGEAPLSVEVPAIQLQLTLASGNAGAAASNEIDFGNGEIDFGDGIDYGDLNAGDIILETGDIDWGENEALADIDYNGTFEDSGIKVESSGLAGGVAKNEEALTLLDSPSHRDQFLDEIFELEAFLKMRLFELNSIETSNSVTFLLSDGLDSHTSDSIVSLLGNVQIVIEKATGEVLQHLHQLKHSEKYADILAAKLQQKVTSVEKMQATRELLKQKIETFKSDKANLQPLIGKLTDQIKFLQVDIEGDISKRYKNRPVNLMGGISLF